VVVTQRRYPTYRGALVVCRGGDRPEVKLAVTEAVAALTGLSADRITVAKWQ
jgi:stage III sporulation protein AG